FFSASLELNISALSDRYRVLVAPLDWGLGHATRCIPIIRELLRQDMVPVLAGTAESLYVMEQDFPDLEALELPGYNVKYSASENLILSLSLQLPGILLTQYAEKKSLRKRCEKQKIDAVISDSRYGLHSNKIPSIFIGHQLTLQTPDFLPCFWNLINRLHREAIQKFDECWVPDYGGAQSLAGLLSKAEMKIPLKYLGPLSRFQKLELSQPEEVEAIDILVILSGPEPQRSLLEKKILEEARGMEQNFLIVQGKAGEKEEQEGNNYRILPFMNTNQLEKAFQRASLIVSRSGYSSLMDYEALGIQRLLLIPTPGQTEQEYLGERWAELGKALVQKQKEVNLKAAWEEVNKLDPLGSFEKGKIAIKEAILSLKERIKLHKQA
ncbi:MAG: glycosyltransferase, partial [Bacteroidota bacterium]